MDASRRSARGFWPPNLFASILGYNALAAGGKKLLNASSRSGILSAPMSLAELLARRASITEIAAHLDALNTEARERETLALDGKAQAQLFETAADAPRITLSHFVPEGTASLGAVHHPGRNTIPPFRRFQDFEKRFVKSSSAEGEVYGYNESAAWFIKPGYFVAYPTDAARVPEAARALWSSFGGVVIDYHLVPPEGAALPPTWPKVVPNSRGLQRFVYHRTRDFMRRVSEHVSVGRASAGDGAAAHFLSFWFVLVRR